jgi:hypothetical protein
MLPLARSFLARPVPSRVKSASYENDPDSRILAWAKNLANWTIEIVKRSDDVHTIQVLPKHWIAE